MNETIRVRSTTDLKERIDRIAERRGCDASDVIREALLRFAESTEQALGITEEKQAAAAAEKEAA